MTTPNPISTYHVVCECGTHVASHEREMVCASCGRALVFEWGRDPVIVTGEKAKAKGAAA